MKGVLFFGVLCGIAAAQGYTELGDFINYKPAFTL